MKNIPVVLIILLLSMPVFAQYDAVRTSMLTDDLNITNPKLNSFSGAERKHPYFLNTNKQPDYKRFLDLYNKKQHADITTSRRLTFMDGPRVFSIVPSEEFSSKPVTLYQKYSANITEPSAALQLLGLAAGITAGAFSHNRYTGVYDPYFYNGNSRYLDGSPRYLGSRASIEAAYLQSTYYQHDR